MNEITFLNKLIPDDVLVIWHKLTYQDVFFGEHMHTALLYTNCPQMMIDNAKQTSNAFIFVTPDKQWHMTKTFDEGMAMIKELLARDYTVDDFCKVQFPALKIIFEIAVGIGNNSLENQVAIQSIPQWLSQAMLADELDLHFHDWSVDILFANSTWSAIAV